MSNQPTRPLDVLFVCNAWTGGGAERVTSTLVKHLDRTVVRPSVCLLRDDVSYPMPEDVPVSDLGYKGVLTFVAAARRLRSRIERLQPDVVVSTVNANALLTGAALPGGARRPPWIARIGNSPSHHDRGLRGIGARRLYRRADRFVANSERLASEVSAVYPFAAGRVITIRNPCDFGEADRLAAAATKNHLRDGPLIVAVGRLAKPKRHDLMLQALAITRRRSQATLWVCGDGPLHRELERLAVRLGVGDAVRWLGFVDNPYAVMAQADLFVLTSDFEGLPNALIEAQGLGLPAVSTDCPTGPDEIVDHGRTGLLVPVGDLEAIAGAMVELVSDAAKRRRMGSAARERARMLFDHRRLVAAWQELLETISHDETGIR